MGNPGILDNIAELRTFAAIVEAGSLVGAAASLGITANAVSRRLSVLEERVGHRLLHRTTRRMSVTDEGRTFFARCRRILDEIDQAEQELAGTDDVAGVLRIAIHTDMIGPTLMNALATMLQQASGLGIQLHVSNAFIEPVSAGLDLSILIGKPKPSSLVAVPLGSLSWGMAASPSYAKRCGLPRTPAELIEHECLRVLRDRRETHWLLRRGQGRVRRYAVAGRFETNEGRALTEALYSGLGIGLRLRSEIDAAVTSGLLVHVLPRYQWAETPAYALLPKGRSKLPRVRAVLDALRETTLWLQPSRGGR